MKAGRNIAWFVTVGIAVGVCGCVDHAVSRSGAGDAIVNVYWPQSQEATSAYSRSEFEGYFSKMFSGGVAFSDSSRGCRVVIGTPSGNAWVGRAVREGRIRLPQGANADQGYAIKTLDGTICIAATTEIGLLYGIYDFFEQYGAYFQISGEILPGKKAFEVKPIDVTAEPVFKYRGILPWDNFLCGMSGYNLEDYQLLIDRATRMKFNMLQFHFYPGMAFYTEVYDGREVPANCIGMPVDVFKVEGAIRSDVFSEKIFGPRAYVEHMGDPAAQGRAVQAMMRQVLDYAHGRGFKTAVGFELMVPMGGGATYTAKANSENGGVNAINPVDPHNVEINVARLRRLTEIYPQSDYYWMWQSEAMGYLGRNGWENPEFSRMRERYGYWVGENPVFGGVRTLGDLDYAYMFREVVNRVEPALRAKVTTGGWNIEHLFPNIDKDFPKETIFASLNHFDPQLGERYQAACYRVAAGGRRMWMIEWWEFDGNEWFPQFRVGRQESMYKQCAKYGVEGVSLLGWKLSGIEHNVRYLAEFSWKPSLSAAAFYENYTQRVYGAEGGELADLYMQYDAMEPTTPGANPADPRAMVLGAGWMAMAIPSLPGRVEDLDSTEWKKTVELAKGELCGIAGQQKLYDMDQKALAALRKAMNGADEQKQRWTALMMNRLEFRCLYLKATMAINESLVRYDQAARRAGIGEARKAAAASAEQAIGWARAAIEKYADDIRNRGDQGVISQLNEVFYAVLKRYHAGLVQDKSAYAEIDWTTFRIHAAIKFDFSRDDIWAVREGAVQMRAVEENGVNALRMVFGGQGAAGHVATIRGAAIDLAEAPYLDFKIRTTSGDALAIMFQTAGDEKWYSLELIGRQSGCHTVDGLEKINDGQWHRVTWNLQKLVSEKLNGGGRIKNLIVGTWEKPAEPVVVEFSDVSLGTRNMLN